MTINERVKKIRKALNLSQTDLSDILEIDPSSVSKLEAGRLNITVKSLQNFHRAKKVDLNWLLCETKTESIILDDSVEILQEPNAEYEMKSIPIQKYLEVVEENRELNKKLLTYMEAEKNKE